MAYKREKLIPSKDLAEFFALRITTCLTAIWALWDDISEDKTLIFKINNQLEEIYKSIKVRMLKYDLEDMVKEYDDMSKKLKLLKPFNKKRVRNIDSDQISNILQINEDYHKYVNLLMEKEIHIWGCLGALGLTGQITIGTKRIR